MYFDVENTNIIIDFYMNICYAM